jgi:tRNA nucleotidyltransferase (CCA-adding enzyme)
MKIYTVGGAVRDELLGLPVKDRDHVVVGACPEDLVKLGFKPVGKNFPVFLHPETHEEYALARTERKVARGYHGFEFHAAPDVTLEQDLARRDLTINAIARDEKGRLIDPFGGAGDIKARVLRHVSPAFAEDPVRVLRVARFSARFGFTIAPETFELMRRIVANGEVDALVAERVWQEFSRGLMEDNPSRMLQMLRECGALARIAPEVDASFAGVEAGAAQRAALDAAARVGASLEARFAALVRSLDPLAVEAFCARLKVPAPCRELALLAARHANAIADTGRLDPQALMELLDAADAWRRPERFLELTAAALAGEPDAGEVRALLERALTAGAAVDAGAIAKAAPGPAGIRSGIDTARLAAIRKTLGHQ